MNASLLAELTRLLRAREWRGVQLLSSERLPSVHPMYRMIDIDRVTDLSGFTAEDIARLEIPLGYYVIGWYPMIPSLDELAEIEFTEERRRSEQYGADHMNEAFLACGMTLTQLWLHHDLTYALTDGTPAEGAAWSILNAIVEGVNISVRHVFRDWQDILPVPIGRPE